jgi:CubicO group peptidase (beta-lactamase class C family)
MEYSTDAGSRWAYHQGAFTLLQAIVTNSTEKPFVSYYNEKLRDKIGMNGTWNPLGFLNLYSSTTRSMARFGLLIQNKGVWNEQTIVSEAYYTEMTNTSQNLNPSYGYLWWLNGKENYMGTSSQEVVQGSLVPNAPDDMFVALGANDQKIYVVPSKGLVIVRCGESAGAEQLGLSSFDNELWGKINQVIE